jgi:membrane protease YdiL (CAAX protease family)
MKSFAKKHPLTLYFFLAYLFTWLIVSPLVATKFGWITAAPGWLHYLAPYGPMLSAIIMTALTGGQPAIKDFFSRLIRWRVNPWVAGVAILSPFILFLIAMIVELVGGSSWPEIGNVQFELMPEMRFWVGTAFIILTYGFGEEAGWRGFALPLLQSQHTAMQASMYLSFGWAAWHLPFFIYKDNFIEMGLFEAIGWVVSLMFGTVFLTWMYNASGGSILMVAIWHGLYDLFTATTLGESLASMLMTFVMIIGVFWIVHQYGRDNLSHLPRQTNH